MNIAQPASSSASDTRASAAGTSGQRLILEPKKGWQPIEIRELVRYRDLLRILALRDIRVRYKQTVLGFLWAVIQPFMYTVVFTVLFGKLAGFADKSEVPYALVTLCALLPWQLFSAAMSNAGNSLLGNAQLVSKVYFPRLIIPLSSILAATVDFGIAFLMLVAMMLFYGVVPGPAVLMLPVFLALALAAALGVGLWASALNVEYRDIRYVLPFLTQLWLYITPVMYPAKVLEEKLPKLAWALALNPMYSVVEGFRWALLGTSAPNWAMMGLSVAVTAILLVSGLFYFRRMEKTFADLV